MPPTSPPTRRTAAPCRAGSSASRSTTAGARRSGSRSRPASSTSGARRRPATSARRRSCSASSPGCMPSITGRKGSGGSLAASIASPTSWRPVSNALASPSRTRAGSTHSPSARRATPRRSSAGPRKRATTSGRSTPTASASPATKPPRGPTSRQCGARLPRATTTASTWLHWMVRHHAVCRQTWCGRLPFLDHPVFSLYHAETELLRYMRRLEGRDLTLNQAMIPLGSCTMKLNATAEMMPITWPGFGAIHPFAPAAQTAGYRDLVAGLERMLSQVTGFAAVSLQPNAGSQGEYAGLLVNPPLSREPRRGRTPGLPDPELGPRHQSGERGDGRDDGDRRGLRRRRQCRPRRPARQGRGPCRGPGGVDDHLPLHPRGVRGIHRRDLRDDPPPTAARSTWTAPTSTPCWGSACPDSSGRTWRISTCTRLFASPTAAAGPGVGPIGVAAHLAPFLPGHPLVPESGPEDGNRPGLGGALGLGRDPADLLGLYRDDGALRAYPGERSRDSQRQLHRQAPGTPLPGALHGRERAGRARVHRRDAPPEAERRNRGGRRGQAPDGLRLPRADHVPSPSPAR